MAKKRDRYTITGRMSANGIDLRGVTVVDLGPCGFAGATKSKTGSKLKNKDLKFRKFRFEDPKEHKNLGLSKELAEFSILNKHISMFLTPNDEENT